MNYYLLLFSLMMTLLFFILFKRKQSKPIIKYVFLTYAILFWLCTASLTTFYAVTHKDKITKLWDSKEPQVKVASTMPLPDPALEPVYPLVEQAQLAPSISLKAPNIKQYPELPRGCEVTSLAMLLQYFDYQVDKMELAKKVKKSSASYQVKGSEIHFGNPAKGFVGDMYSFSKPGHGVYHGPIAKLAKEYAGNQVEDFSGGSFYEIIKHLNAKRPVWVITNTTFKKLPDSAFQTWNTPDGKIKVTMKEHSVLVTGYDDKSIYFNDPISGTTKKAPIKSFEEAWVQMGKQAITVVTP
ncbi:C39 family peptidase [Radiobacillus kanasensis]|uniref:C39 family peptidase n=1 Tax=Radiobacillus kanasensis TaxID=2844358 RepID=UPI001E5D3340|nr:C39 family peptidase [Radiobacillus kanasensis]UFT98166.1 C39 family peptidase [Radiobacillus kanasensis]